MSARAQLTHRSAADVPGVTGDTASWTSVHTCPAAAVSQRPPCAQHNAKPCMAHAPTNLFIYAVPGCERPMCCPVKSEVVANPGSPHLKPHSLTSGSFHTGCQAAARAGDKVTGGQHQEDALCQRPARQETKPLSPGRGRRWSHRRKARDRDSGVLGAVPGAAVTAGAAGAPVRLHTGSPGGAHARTRPTPPRSSPAPRAPCR